MVEAGKQFVSPTGYIDLDNDCNYSIDLKSTRSREYVNPKDDLAFYFQNYLAPKYGLNNINVGNVASFMKELEMNWSKLTPELKDQVLSIMVDGILPVNYDFKNNLLKKLGIAERVNIKPILSKSSFGKTNNQEVIYILGGLIAVVLIFVLLNKIKKSPGGFPKMF